MAVRANDLALVDLVEHGLPAPIREPLTDVKHLVALADVVELEHDRVRLAALHARMKLKELKEVRRPLEARLSPQRGGIRDVSRPVGPVVHAPIGSPTRPAHRIALEPSATAPRKRLDGLGFTALPAALGFGCHEHMFA
jgi:hypothetical protein